MLFLRLLSPFGLLYTAIASPSTPREPREPHLVTEGSTRPTILKLDNNDTNPTSAYPSKEVPYPLVSNTTNLAYSYKWNEAHRKARRLLSTWSTEEKVNLTTGVGWEVGRCVGNTPAIPSKNWTGFCLEDSPLGVRFADFVSAFPAGINVAST